MVCPSLGNMARKQRFLFFLALKKMAYYVMFNKRVGVFYVMFNKRVGVFYHNIKHDA